MIIGLLLVLLISSCANLYYALSTDDYRKMSWTLRANEPVFANYLSEEEVLNYDRKEAAWHKYIKTQITVSGVREPFRLAAEVDSRNLIRHLVNKVSNDPGKSKYYVKIQSRNPVMAGGWFLSSSTHISGGDPSANFMANATKKIYSKHSYSDHKGYGEILIGDGAYIIRYWAKTDSNRVKIGVENINDKAVDPSHFNDKKSHMNLVFKNVTP